MTYEQLSQLIPNVTGLTITSHVQNSVLHTYTLSLNGERLVQRRFNREIVVFTPSIVQYRTTLRRQTTSHWSIESNGSTFRAIDIERLPIEDRMSLDVYRNQTIYFIQNGNQETGESWTEIHEAATNRLLAMIDYIVPSRSSFTGTHITFTTPFTRHLIDTDGLHLNWTNGNETSSAEISRNRFALEHDAVIPTESNWQLPGHQPIITASDIESMNSSQRDELALDVESHGNVLRFISGSNQLTGEVWTDVEYDNEIVARIDQRIHQQISADGSEIIIGDPREAHLSLYQHGLRWVNYLVTGEVTREDVTISGIVGEVTRRTVHNVMTGIWSWAVRNPRDAMDACATIHFLRGNLFSTAIYLPIRRALNPLSLLSAEEVDSEVSLQTILDWCLNEENGSEMDITLEHANEKVVSFETCMNIALMFRDSLKGPLALMCSKIMDIEENGSTGTVTRPASTSDIENIESRIVELERKTANIESTTEPNTSGELTLANLLKSYDERITALEKKCANIQ